MSKKYVLLVDGATDDDFAHIEEQLRKWLEGDLPLAVIDMGRFRLLEVEKEDA